MTRSRASCWAVLLAVALIRPGHGEARAAGLDKRGDAAGGDSRIEADAERRSRWPEKSLLPSWLKRKSPAERRREKARKRKEKAAKMKKKEKARKPKRVKYDRDRGKLGRRERKRREALLKEHAPWGLPGAGEVLFREGYILSHNDWLKIPDWVAYHLSRKNLSGSAERSNDFRSDLDLRPWQRSEPEDYGKSGYARGQLAPPEAMRRGARAMSESFLLSNVAPQVRRGFKKGVWGALEEKTLQWAIERDEVWVLTGPVFHDVDKDGVMEFKLIGKSRVAAPTHFFKIVVDELPDGSLDIIAFLLPNKKGSVKSLPGFRTSIDRIEALTGLDFLDELPDDVEELLERAKAERMWK
ncbi:MAG: DNA/RNA non-specific endonuclease [Elusimicrobiota bacterium]